MNGESTNGISNLRIRFSLTTVVIGLLIFTNKFTIIAKWLTPYLPVY